MGEKDGPHRQAEKMRYGLPYLFDKYEGTGTRVPEETNEGTKPYE